MFDKILDNFEYICGAILIVLIAVLGYNLGSSSRKNEICQKIGGVYVSTYEGNRCLYVKEIEL
jgi:hypothetical protein